MTPLVSPVAGVLLGLAMASASSHVAETAIAATWVGGQHGIWGGEGPKPAVTAAEVRTALAWMRTHARQDRAAGQPLPDAVVTLGLWLWGRAEPR